MADKPFDRETWNTLEKPLSPDNNQEATYSDLATRTLWDRSQTPRASATDFTMQTTPPCVFLGDGFKVVAQSPAAMAVNVTAGLGSIGDTTSTPSDIGGLVGVDDLSRQKPLVLNALQTFTVPANASGSTRIDIIELKYRRELTDNTVRSIMGTVAPFTFANAVVPKTLTWALDSQTGTVTSPSNSTAYLSYKIGVAGAGVPATTAGYTKICEITVASGAVSIAQTEILDFRRLPGSYGKQEVEFVVSIVPGTGVATLLGFHAPPGVETPTIAGGVEANGRMVWSFQLNVSGLPPGSYSANRANIVTTMDVANNNYFPICTNRAVTVTGTNPLSGQVQSIILEMAAALALAAPPRVAHANPTVYRTRITFW